jgi:hypothetical protein
VLLNSFSSDEVHEQIVEAVAERFAALAAGTQASCL